MAPRPAPSLAPPARSILNPQVFPVLRPQILIQNQMLPGLPLAKEKAAFFIPSLTLELTLPSLHRPGLGTWIADTLEHPRIIAHCVQGGTIAGQARTWRLCKNHAASPPPLAGRESAGQDSLILGVADTFEQVVMEVPPNKALMTIQIRRCLL